MHSQTQHFVVLERLRVSCEGLCFLRVGPKVISDFL